MRRAIVFLLAAFCVLGAVACSDSETFEGECKRDSDCEAFERCDTMDYRCVCASDEACASGEYCNASGSCQVKTGCYSNDDCTSGSVCDTASGACIASTACTRDDHCDIGQVCVAGVCRLGCNTTADCDLARREVCLDGACQFGRCENNLYCDFGQTCNTAQHACEQPAAPFCTPDCSPICDGCTDKTAGPCGDPLNICFEAAAAVTFCWVYCATNEECPSGYSCVATTAAWATCAEDSDCGGVRNTCGQLSHRCALNQQPCDVDADCEPFPTSACLSGYCTIGSHCEPLGGCS